MSDESIIDESLVGQSDKKQPDDRAAVIDRGFRWLTRWGVRLIVIAAASLIIGWVIGRFWAILLPILIALILCTVLCPLSGWLRRQYIGGFKIPDSVAAVAALLIFLGGLAGVIAILAPQVAGQSSEVVNGAVQGIQAIQDWVQEGPIGVTDDQIEQLLDEGLTRLQDSAGDIGAGVVSTLGTATNMLINTVLALVLTFFFLKDGHRFIPWLQALGGKRAGVHVAEAVVRSWNTLGGFIRAQALVSLVSAAIIGGALVAFGVPLAIPLAVITYISGFVPIVGAFVAGALATLITLVTIDFQTAVIMLIIIIAAMQLEGNVISPWLQGKTMKLHAAVVLMAVTLGSTMFGITGAFFAVPVVAVVAEVLRYINEQIDAHVDAEEFPEDARGAELLDELSTQDSPDHSDDVPEHPGEKADEPAD